MKIAVTGANGYIGSHVLRLAKERNIEILALSRRPLTDSHVAWCFYELSDKSAPLLPEGTTAVIHLAANTSGKDQADLDEGAALASLLQAAKRVNSKFIFVSSQTAQQTAPTVYGQSKWRLEQQVLRAGGCIVRPGQVYGGAARGLFGNLVALVKRLPLLPAFFPGVVVQPIHVKDLAEGLLRLAERDDLSASILQLAAEPVSFAYFLSAIAQHRLRRMRGFVPVPIALVNVTGALLGARLRARFGWERLNSLFNLPPMKTAEDLRRLGLPLRCLESGMHPSGDGQRRQLLQEGRILLSYVLREQPGMALQRRYVRAVQSMRTTPALGLPPWLLRFPSLLALLESPAFLQTSKGSELRWRLDAATVLAEATPQGSRRFLGLHRQGGWLLSCVVMGKAVLTEVGWCLSRLIFFPFVRRLQKQVSSHGV